MTKTLKEYSIAFDNHLQAQREETVSKDKVRKTRHALMLAREELRSVERDLLEDNIKDL